MQQPYHGNFAVEQEHFNQHSAVPVQWRRRGFYGVAPFLAAELLFPFVAPYYYPPYRFYPPYPYYSPYYSPYYYPPYPYYPVSGHLESPGVQQV